MMMTKVSAETRADMDTKYLRRKVHDRTTHPGVCAVLENLLQYYTQELSNRNNLQKDDVKSQAWPEPRFVAKDRQQGSSDIRHLTTFQLVRAKFLRAAANQSHTRQCKVGSTTFRRPCCLVKQASSDEMKKQTVGRQRVKNLVAIFAAEEKSDTNHHHTGTHMQIGAKPLARRSVLAAIEKFETLGSVQSVDCRNAWKNKDTDTKIPVSETGEQISDKRQRPKGRCQASDKSGTVQSPTAAGENLPIAKSPTTQGEQFASVQSPTTQGEKLATVQSITNQGENLATAQKPSNQGEKSAVQSPIENIDGNQSEQQLLKNSDYKQEIKEATQQEQVLGKVSASERSGKESLGDAVHTSLQLTAKEENWASEERVNYLCEVIQWNSMDPPSSLCFTVEPQKIQQVAIVSYPQVWCLSTSESLSTTQFMQGSHHTINQPSLLSLDYLETKSREITVDTDIKRVTEGLHDAANTHDLTKSFQDQPQPQPGEPQPQPCESRLKCTQLHGLRVLTGSKKLMNFQSDSVCARPDIPFHSDTEGLRHESKLQSKDFLLERNLNFSSDSVEDRCQSNRPQPQSENDSIPKAQLSGSDDTSPTQSVFHSEKQSTKTDLMTPTGSSMTQLYRQQHITNQGHDISSPHTTNATSHGQDISNNKSAIERTLTSDSETSKIISMSNETQKVNEDTTLCPKTENDLKTESLTKNPSQIKEDGRSEIQPGRPKYRTFHCEDPCVKTKYIPKTIRFTDTF